MTKFLILHGTGGSPASNWFMWLKGILIGQGHSVWLPQLPGADKPDSKRYTEFLLSNKDFVFDKDTVIIGHSSGAVAALHLLQNLPEGTTIKAAFLVSAFKNNLNWPSLDDLFTEPLDFDGIKQHCENITFIHSIDDPYCPLEHAEYLAEQSDGDLLVFEGQGHFNTETDPRYKHFPELLEIIDSRT